MVDGEDRERDPDWGRGGGADLEHRQTNDPDGENDLQVEIVMGRELDLAIDAFDEIDDGARGMRMTGQEFRLGLDAVGQLVELGVGAVVGAIPAIESTMRFGMAAE